MSFNDILGLGKVLPIDKLLDMLSESVGAFTKSYFDRRDIDTKAYEITKLTEAKVGAMKMITAAIKESSDGVGGINYNEGGMTIESLKEKKTLSLQSSPDPSLEERTRSRIDYQEAKRQHNIEGVTSFAFEELKDEPPVTDEPVDEGWASRFFEYAKDVSSEEMQSIWGRILAGEIKQPNTYSLRTLEVLRNLTKKEAELFTIVCKLALDHEGVSYLYRSQSNSFLSERGVDFVNLAVLREAGLVHEGEFTSLRFLQPTEGPPAVFTANRIAIFLDKKVGSPQKDLPVYVFTQVGTQLSKLVKAEPDLDFLNAFAESVKDENTTINYAFVVERNGDIITYTNPLLDFPIVQAQ